MMKPALASYSRWPALPWASSPHLRLQSSSFLFLSLDCKAHHRTHKPQVGTEIKRKLSRTTSPVLQAHRRISSAPQPPAVCTLRPHLPPQPSSAASAVGLGVRQSLQPPFHGLPPRVPLLCLGRFGPFRLRPSLFLSPGPAPTLVSPYLSAPVPPSSPRSISFLFFLFLFFFSLHFIKPL